MTTSNLTKADLTRQRISDAAAQLFREHGYEGVGIDRIMEAAGLTRGGFYAHFRSKEALFVHILGAPFDFTAQLRKLVSMGRGDAAGLRAAFRAYLDPDRRDVIGKACSMATLAAEAPRQPEPGRILFSSALEGLTDEIERMGGPPRTTALPLIALAVGALTLARACPDREAREILQNAFYAVEGVLGAE